MTDTTREHAIWCSICELKHSENTASVFCAECDQAFCSDCDVHHKLSKPLKDHVTVPIEHFRLLPPFITKVETYCNEHGKPFELYCPDHKEPICVMCLVVTHRCCASILPLQQVITNVNKADILDEYITNVESTCHYIENVREECLSSLSKFKYDMDNIKEIFVSLRKDINDYLDEIQSNILSSLGKSYKEYEENCNKMFIALSENEMKLQQLKNDIEKSKKYATILQTFLVSTNIENLISENKSFLQNLVSSILLQEVDTEDLASVDVKTNMNQFLKAIRVRELKSRVDYVTEKTKHAQLSVVTPKSIEQIQLSHETEIHFKSGHVRSQIVGCTIRETGEYVFSDYSANRRLIVFNISGLFDRQIKTREQPCCLAFIDKNRLAITFGEACVVEIRDFVKGNIMVQIPLNERCGGIQFIDGYLIVRSDDHIFKIDEDGQVVNSFELAVGNSPHFYIQGKSIVIAQLEGVSWLNLDGQFRKQYILADPCTIEGVAIDNYGNVFASLYSKKEVVVIAQNGSRHKVLLDSDDGLDHPTGIYYNSYSEKLLVVTSSADRAVVYTVGQK